jgi:flagellar motor switch protein FliG
VAGGLDFAKELLEQSLGPDKAKEMMDDIAAGTGQRRFEWLKGSNASQLASCLQGERPQVIALILAHLPANQAADVIAQLPQEMQGAIAYRLTSMRPVAPEIVKAIDEKLKEKLAREGTGVLRSVGGLQSLVTILNNADRSTESKILEYLEQTGSGIAENVRQMMFVFEDIIKLNDRMLQLIIRELDQEDLRLSLKGASEEIKDAFFRNMSERAAEVLRDDLEMMGPVKLRDVEAARRRVVAVIHRLDEAGEISIRPDDEEIVM